VKLVAAAMTTAEFDGERLEARAADGWTTLTELADTLVRDQGLAFKSAHAIASRLMAVRECEPDRPLAQLLEEASRQVLGSAVSYSDTELTTILSPRHFVNVRKTLGGPAPEETARAAHASRLQLEADDAWWNGATGALSAAERRLAERSAAL
jgi:argininosuccinate lyase